MNFTAFFFFLFLVSLSLSLCATFFPNYLHDFMSYFPLKPYFTFKFFNLLTLVTSFLSALGFLLSYSFEKKKEKARIKKLQEERINLEKIHAELADLQKA